MADGDEEMDELAWIYAIAKAEGAVPRHAANARELIQRLRDQKLSAAARHHLADFLDRHKFEFSDMHRPAQAKRRLRNWALSRKPRLVASLRSDSPSRYDGPHLAVLLRELKTEKVKGRPRIASYLQTDVDAKLKIAAEEYRVQLWLGETREKALQIAAATHGVTVEGLRASVDGKSSKRRRRV